MIDTNANTVYANSYMADMLGYTKDEMIGKHLFFFMDEPAIESAKKYLKRRSEGIQENHTFKFTHKNGKNVFTEINTYPLFDNDGKYNGALAAITDITETKNLQDTINKLELKFKAIFDSASIGLAVLNEDLQFLDANKKLCEKLGYSKHELLSSNLFSIISSSAESTLQDNLNKLKNGTLNAFMDEYKFLRKNGSTGWGIANFFVFQEEQKKGQNIISSLRDISDKKNIEYELLKKEALLKAIFGQSSSAITVWDTELKNIYANPVAFELFGRDRNTVPQRRYMREGAPNFPHIYEKWEKRVTECFDTGLSRNFTDVDDFAGKTIYSESTVNPIRDYDGNVFAVAIIFRNVTQRVIYEKEFNERERLILLGKMAAHVSHEIRSPLASISMNLDFLSQNLTADERQKKSFDLINGEIHRLNNLLKDILSFTGEFSLRKTNFDIKETLEKIERLLKQNLKAKKIIFINNIQSQIIYGDDEKIEGVLIDLIENSIEAISDKGTIELYSYCKSSEDFYELFIKDTGCGIENSSKLFVPFYTTKPKGTGLGLSIVKNIIEKHGGTINLLSSKPGETIFQIRLPVNEKINL